MEKKDSKTRSLTNSPLLGTNGIINNTPLLFNKNLPSRLNSTESFDYCQHIFDDKCKRIASNIVKTRDLVNDLRNVSGSNWKLMYPDFNTKKDIIKMARSNSFSIPKEKEEINVFPVSSHKFENLNEKVLKILNYQNQKNFNYSVPVETSEILLEKIFEGAKTHLDKLYIRVTDKTSKVLVTGDLNSGKSSLVNALLKQRLLPCDQQPCTMTFCEIIDASKNKNVDQVHAIPVGSTSEYHPEDQESYNQIDKSLLNKTVSEDYKDYELIKIYCSSNNDNKTMIHNGSLNVTLIDSPGLNRDFLKTTQLFSRQEEIDAVGKEFLESAGKEKQHIFIVVNRFDSIRDKERCRHLILEQIKVLSPRTYEEAEDLVHFVSAESCFSDDYEKINALPSCAIPVEFKRLEKSLRTFILDKRSRTKLLPAKHFLNKLLSDIFLFSEFNIQAIKEKTSMLESKLLEIEPVQANLLQQKNENCKAAEECIEKCKAKLNTQTQYKLEKLSTHLVAYISIPSSSVSILWGFNGYIKRLQNCLKTTLDIQLSEVDLVSLSFTKQTQQTILDMFQNNPANGVTTYKEMPLTVDLDWVDQVDFSLLDLIPTKEIRNKATWLFGGVGILSLKFMSPKDILSAISWYKAIFSGDSENSNVLLASAIGLAALSLISLASIDWKPRIDTVFIQKAQEHLVQLDFPQTVSNTVQKRADIMLQSSLCALYSRYQDRIATLESQKLDTINTKKSLANVSKRLNAIMKEAKNSQQAVDSIETDDFASLRSKLVGGL